MFDEDKVRWKCAWDLLASKGWVVLLPEFGYVVPPEARILNHIPLVATAEGRLWERWVGADRHGWRHGWF